jgi:thiol-disulfide isomerase/thioredoxin
MSKAQRSKSGNRQRGSVQSEIEGKETACVLFYATWCPYSQRFLPIFEEYSRRNPKGCLSVIIDDKPDVCEEFAIDYYPTVILFKKGKVHRRLDAQPGVGLNKKQLENLIEKQ